MNKVYRQLLTELENLGVKPIEAVGKEFDPNFHNAVMQVENDELEPGTVAQELLEGLHVQGHRGTSQHGRCCAGIRSLQAAFHRFEHEHKTLLEIADKAEGEKL